MPQLVPADRLDEYVGRLLGPSEWLRIDQTRIDAFAEITEDRQFIHVDPALAAKTPLGTTVAHGFLTLSLLTRLTADIAVLPDGAVMGFNYGFDRVRFIQPVRVNDEIRATMTLESATEQAPAQYRLVSSVTIEIRGSERPALVATWIGLVFTA